MEQWHRQQGESSKAYEAAWIYIQAGPERSLSSVARQLSKSDTLIKRWSRDWRWVERAEAYDRHMSALEQKRIEDERERLAEEKAAVWSERLEQLREDEFALAQEIKRRILTMLKFPVEEQTIEHKEGGKTITIVKPVKWTANDMGRLALVYSKLGRLAAGAETDRDFDFDNLSDEQLDKIARTGRL